MDRVNVDAEAGHHAFVEKVTRPGSIGNLNPPPALPYRVRLCPGRRGGRIVWRPITGSSSRGPSQVCPEPAVSSGNGGAAVSPRAAAQASVTLSTGEVIKARTVVWSAGVRPTGPTADAHLPRSRSERLEVDERLRLKGVEGVHAIGDLASVRQDGGELPMLSPPAMQGGRHAARAILTAVRGRSVEGLRPFRYVDKGVMATIGRNAAVAQTGALRLSGFIGWLAWLVVHIYYLIGFRNRLAVLASWAWNYIRKDRSIRIIARSEADPLTEEMETGRGTPPRPPSSLGD